MRPRRLIAGARRRLPFAGQAGMTIVEIGVAMMVMAVAIIGVIGSMGSGLNLVGQSRQRSSATAVAQERLERIQNIPYLRVALYQQPAHSTDPDDPDFDVTTDGRSYQVAPGLQEPLVICTNPPASPPPAACVRADGTAVDGALKHIDDPVSLGTTEFNVHQVVTWHDDPAITGTTQDVKRVIIVVTWKYPVRSGQVRRVVTSSFIGPKGVVVGSTPTPAPSASATPTPAPSVTPPPPSDPCGSATVLSGTGAVTGFTNSTSVQLQLSGTQTCTPTSVDLSNDGVAYTQVASAPFPQTVTWTIPAGDGTKIIYVRTHDAQNKIGTTSGQIALDQRRPPSATNLVKASCSISGSNRTITMNWGTEPTSDANFLGYRIYKSIENAAFTALLTTGSPTASNTDAKGYSSLRYIVRGYDKAGNESLDSNVLAFTANNC